MGTHAPWDMPTDAVTTIPELIDIYRRYDPAPASRSSPTSWPPRATRRRACRSSGRCRSSTARTARSTNLWDQYLFGPDLLVAPVWKVGRAAAHRLPARAARGGATGIRLAGVQGPAHRHRGRAARHHPGLRPRRRRGAGTVARRSCAAESSCCRQGVSGRGSGRPHVRALPDPPLSCRSRSTRSGTRVAPRDRWSRSYCEPSLCAREMKTWATDFPSCTPATLSIG